MNCCTNCFQDAVLVAFVRRNGRIGTCDFCASRRVKTISPTDLLNLFKPVIAEFERVGPDDPRPGGRLCDALEWMPGWKIFSRRLSSASKMQLLRGMFSAPKINVGGNWAPRMDSILFEAIEAIWWNFSQHIKGQRRFILGNQYKDDPKNWLPAFLPSVSKRIPKSKRLYRARVGYHDSGIEAGYQPFPHDQLGAPPKDKITRGGRANPPGIAYLYTAEEEATAVAEVKPFIGALVSASAFNPKIDLKIVDLTQAHRIQSPFGHANLTREILRCDLLRFLNEELAEPVDPDRDSIEYVPCQYIVEVIRDSGFDGVRYRSAMRNGGHNIVFFDPDNFIPVGSPMLFRIREQQIKYEIWKPPTGGI
jgi:hypothetical protein